MLFSKVLVALSAATSVAAYAIPAGAADGSYVAFKIDGKEVHLTMEDYLKKYPQAAEGKVAKHSPTLAGISPASEGNPLMKRDQFMFCGCGYNMVDWETDRAVQGLKDQYNNGQSLPPRAAIYTIRGPVVAFTCNRTDFRQGYSPQGIGEQFALITRSCGRYIAGSAKRNDWLYGEVIIGYMRYNGNGHDFCRESTGSTRESC